MRRCFIIVYLLCFPGMARASERGSAKEAVEAALSGGEPEYLEEMMKAFTDQIYEFTQEKSFRTPQQQQNLYFTTVAILSALYQVAENVHSHYPYSLPVTAARMSDWYKVQSILSSSVSKLPVVLPYDVIEYVKESVHSIMYYEISDLESLHLEQSSAILFRLSELFIWRYVLSHPNLLRENYVLISQHSDKTVLENNPFENKHTLDGFQIRFLVSLNEIPTERSDWPLESNYLTWFRVFKVLVMGNTKTFHPPSPRSRVPRL